MIREIVKNDLDGLFSRTQRAKRKLACTWRLRAGQIPRPSGANLLKRS